MRFQRLIGFRIYLAIDLICLLGVSGAAALVILEFEFGLLLQRLLPLDPAFGLLATPLVFLLLNFPPVPGVAAGVRWHRSKR